MITSKDNSKLKLARSLHDRRGRRRAGAFATEGEDLLELGLAAGTDPLEVLVAAGTGISGEEVEPALLDAASTLGSGTRVIAIWPLPGDEAEAPDPVVYAHGVGDPGNVGTIVRTAEALTGGTVLLGPDCADPYSPKAVRASMGALFAAPPRASEPDDLGDLAVPRLGLVAHGGAPLDDALASLGAMPLLCLGGEREGLPAEVLDDCDAQATIPLRGRSESLNVAAAAAIALQRISSLGLPGGD